MAQAQAPTLAVQPATPALLTRGAELYVAECAACHGPEGKADGPAAYLLYPKPRDFVNSAFRLVSTWERLPTDQDLFHTITRGMPGSSMPPFRHLSESDRWALVHHVKSLSERAWPGDAANLQATGGDERVGLIDVPSPSGYTPEAREAAVQLYGKGCAACHGATGRGDGEQVQINSEGFPMRPRDLSKGIFKGLYDPESVYRRIVAGIPGTPMPMSDWAYGDEAWLLTQYVLSLSSEEQRDSVESWPESVRVVRAERLPDHPDSHEWQAAAPVQLKVTPLWWRDVYADRVTVRALHDGKDIAIQLIWSDSTHDHTAIRAEDFRDAAAVQMSPSLAPPFIGMGEPAKPVTIWMWKSERQVDIETSFQDIETTYPNIGIDSYPNVEASPLEQPTRHTLTLKSNPTFVTGWGAGNIVSDPTYRLSAENLSARGFGSLSVRPIIDQNVGAEGRYDTSTYSVTFRRALHPEGDTQLALDPGAALSVAFAVWDGSAGDRDGKKSVTIWNEMKLDP